MLEIAFETKELRELCESTDAARNTFGDDVAASLRRRLADLRAATCFSDIVASPPTQVDGGSLMAIDLANDCRIFLAANHIRNPMLESGQIDWLSIDRIKIVDIK